MNNNPKIGQKRTLIPEGDRSEQSVHELDVSTSIGCLKKNFEFSLVFLKITFQFSLVVSNNSLTFIDCNH